jgi:non-specific protein-tyrosine kinase
VELRQYYFIIRRWLWLIAVCTVLGAGAAFLVSQRTTPVYQASATLLVQRAPSGDGSDYQDILTSERLARTYSEMLKGRPVMEDVIERLGLRERPEDLAGRLSVELVRDTQLIRLNVEHTEPAQAARVANAVADAFVARIEGLQQQRYAESMGSLRQEIDDLARLIEETERKIEDLGVVVGEAEAAEEARLEGILAGYRNTYSTLVQNYESMRVTAARTADDVTLYEEANAPRSPVRPRAMMNTALAGVVGAMIGLGTAFLIEYLDDSIRSPRDVEQATGLETVGTIGRSSAEGELVVAQQPLSPVAEGFRKLRTNMEFLGIEGELRSVLVTSPGPREGKSTVAANLAAAAAQAGRFVILVEGDLRQPGAGRAFKRASSVGLTNALLEGRLNGKIQATEVKGLRFLAAGEEPPNPAEMLGSRRMREILEDLVAEADLVIIDSAPVLPVADSVVLGQQVDGVLLVVDVGRTRRSAAEQAVEGLRQAGANVVGAVLNNVTSGSGSYTYYGYGNDYGGYYGGNGDRHSEGNGKSLLARAKRALRVER